MVVLKIKTPPPELDAAVYGAVFRSKRIRRVRYMVAGAVVHRALFCIDLVGVDRMNKHTPGPWIATKFNPVTGDIDDCYLYVEPGIAVIERKVKGRDQHDTANARLLAAAPDLLEALEELEQSVLAGSYEDPSHDRIFMALKKASAAIGKARGEV